MSGIDKVNDTDVNITMIPGLTKKVESIEVSVANLDYPHYTEMWSHYLEKKKIGLDYVRRAIISRNTQVEAKERKWTCEHCTPGPSRWSPDRSINWNHHHNHIYANQHHWNPQSYLNNTFDYSRGHYYYNNGY